MSCRTQSITDIWNDAGAGFTNSDSSEMRRYVLERPQLVLTVLDLMEKLECEKDFLAVKNHKEATRHAS